MSSEIVHLEPGDIRYQISVELPNGVRSIRASIIIDPNGKSPEEVSRILGGIFNVHPNEIDLIQADTPYHSLNKLLEETPPKKRIRILAVPSKLLNKLINKACREVEDSRIKEFITYTPDELEDMSTIIKELFESVYNRVLDSIKDTVIFNYLNNAFNGQLTYVKSLESMLDENKYLVPDILVGVFREIMEQGKMEFKPALEILAAYGPLQFNNLIYGLRIGRNGAVMRDYNMGEQFDIGFGQDGKLIISLNKTIVEKKRADLILKNKQNQIYPANFEKIKCLAAQAGILIDLEVNYDFGFYHGYTGLCPVTYADKSGGDAYLPQVELAFRILQALINWIEKSNRS
jgi:hypothetical protein